MRIKTLSILLSKAFVLLSCMFPYVSAAQVLSAKEIISKADEKMRGNSSIQTTTMTIQRPKWTRSISMKIWSLGTDYSLVLITAPAQEKGQVFLKRGNEMWNWRPSIQRMIKLPPSMMMQSWMGSDFTNDDMVKQSSIITDYSHTLLATEAIENIECYKIQLIPSATAAVVWGKIIVWVSKTDFNQMKIEFFDEDLKLVNTQLCRNVKKMDDRNIPTIYEIIPSGKPDQKTILELNTADFNVPLKEDFFSQQNMKKIN